MLTSTSSVIIVLVLLLSIFYQGIPAFSALPKGEINANVNNIDTMLSSADLDAEAVENLNSRKEEIAKQLSSLDIPDDLISDSDNPDSDKNPLDELTEISSRLSSTDLEYEEFYRLTSRKQKLVMSLSVLDEANSVPLEKLASELQDINTKLAGAGLDAAEVQSLKTQKEEMGELEQTIDNSFFSKVPAPGARRAGIGPALMGSIWVCIGCTVFFLPLGVGTAIFLEEFKPKNKVLRWLTDPLQLNINNLAGVPSIVYGILGLTVFATMFGFFGSPNEPFFELGTKFKRQYVTEGMQVVFIPVTSRDEVPTLSDGMAAYKSDGSEIQLNVIGDDDDFPEDDATLNVSVFSDSEGGVVADNSWYSFRLPFGRSVLAASLTLMLVILPVVIISTQEALRAVPSSLRQGAQGLGCTPWQTVSNVTLPAAIPGIMTCLLYTSPSPRDRQKSRMPSSA